MNFTKVELDFLTSKSLTKADIYDGTGLSQDRFKLLIKKAEKLIGYGNPCTKGRHRLKWPSAHCAVCNPNNRVFSNRYTETKYIYIAGSLSHQLHKIGVGDDYDRRVATLRRQSYAGAHDWQLLFHMKVPNSARLENDALSSLSKYKVNMGYIKDGNKQVAIEVVKCSYVKALRAISNYAITAESDPWQSPKVDQYDFK